MEKRWRTAVAVAATLLATTAGCGSSGTSGDGADPTQGIDGKTILIGSSSILSGPYAAYTQAADGFNAYIDQTNDSGGVDGYTFKVVQQDNGYQAAQSVTVARSLVFQEKVFALALAGTTPAAATLPIADKLKVPIITLANADVHLETIKNVFGVIPSFSRMAMADVQYLTKQLSTKKIAYAYTNDDVGQTPLGMLPDYVKSQGAALTTTAGFAPTTTDYSSYAARLKQSDADAVLVFAGPTSLAGLQRAAAAIDYHPKWFGHFNSLTPSYVDLAGPSAEGTYLDNLFDIPDSNTPEAQQFRSKVPPKSTSILGQFGWVQAALIVEGVKRATADGKQLTAAGFMDALSTLKDTRIGVWPDVTFTPDSHSGGNSQNIVQVQGGKFVEVTQPEPLPALPNS